MAAAFQLMFEKWKILLNHASFHLNQNGNATIAIAQMNAYFIVVTREMNNLLTEPFRMNFNLRHADGLIRNGREEKRDPTEAYF